MNASADARRRMHDPGPWRHEHDYLPDHSLAERGTRWVMWLTALTMVVEIVAGSLLGSMALLADGWHMATHVAAFGIALFAYRYARRHAGSPRYTFGTGKVPVLGAFASAVTLAMVALFMAVECVQRLADPRPIRFDEALWVASLGLAVNVVSALILARSGTHHHHDHDHDHGQDHGHHDHNLRAAYLHVLADALTSVLAIVALLAGKFAGWHWLDPVIGLVGAAVILRWSWGLARQTSEVLLDGGDHRELAARITERLRDGGATEIADLHLWPVAPGRLAASVSLVSHDPRTPSEYKARLVNLPGLVHVTIEVNECRDPGCRAGESIDETRP